MGLSAAPVMLERLMSWCVLPHKYKSTMFWDMETLERHLGDLYTFGGNVYKQAEAKALHKLLLKNMCWSSDVKLLARTLKDDLRDSNNDTKILIERDDYEKLANERFSDPAYCKDIVRFYDRLLYLVRWINESGRIRAMPVEFNYIP